MSSIFSKTWVFQTMSETKYRIGGALCISPDGLILTVAHNLEITGVERNTCRFYGRASDDTGFRRLTVVRESRNFDLVLLKVVDNEEGKQFDCYSLGEESDGVEVDINEGVVAYLHQNNHVYTKKTGITCSSFPVNAGHTFPNLTDMTTLEAAGFPDENTWTDHDYKTLEYVAEPADEQFMDMHPELPLIQVAGFDDDAGSSGCPFFKINGGNLLGLCSFSKQTFQYLLPLDLLKAFVRPHV